MKQTTSSYAPKFIRPIHLIREKYLFNLIILLLNQIKEFNDEKISTKR
jgi:hypothetical protein